MVNKTHHITEIKCKCNQCKKVWHYLKSDELKLQTEAVGQHLTGCGSFMMCCGCNPFTPLYMKDANATTRKLDKFKQCPECSSRNITKKEINHEKKT